MFLTRNVTAEILSTFIDHRMKWSAKEYIFNETYQFVSVDSGIKPRGRLNFGVGSIVKKLCCPNTLLGGDPPFHSSSPFGKSSRRTRKAGVGFRARRDRARSAGVGRYPI